MADFQMGQAMGLGDQAQTPDQQQAQNIGAAFGKVAEYGKNTVENSSALQETEKKFEMSTDHKAGTTTMTLPTEAAQEYMKSYQEMGHIRQIYQQQVQQNQQQQDQMRQHPWQNALAQIAASVGASSKDPLVRGMGDAAQRLNPTMDQLQQRQQGMLHGEQQAAQGSAGIAAHMM